MSRSPGTRTRKVRAQELLVLLKRGPKLGIMTSIHAGRAGIVGEEIMADVKLWLDTWVIPEVERLIPELKK